MGVGTLAEYENSDAVGLSAHHDERPVVSLLYRWRVENYVGSVLCRMQQRLETQLLDRSRRTKSGSEISSGIDRILYEDHRVAADAEVTAMTAVLHLQDLVPYIQAKSLVDVVAKLEMIVGADREIGDPTDFPWPHLASVLDDLKAIAGDLPVTKPDRLETRAMVSKYLAEAKESLAAQAAKSVQSRGRQNDPEISDLHHPRFL